MKPLLSFINGMPIPDRAAFFSRCETTEGYLRKAISTGQKIGESICINIERESNRAIKCEQIRPDVDWATVRTCDCKKAAA